MTRYYYAGGRRVDLEADDALVAVDQERAEAAGVKAAADTASARRLPGGVVIAARSDISGPQLAALTRAGALRPVYRHHRALMVAMPEIRVEVDTAKQRKAVFDAISSAPFAVEVADETSERIVLRPCSGLSDDALAVANYVYEHAHPAAAAVRFVQFVPRPDPAR